MCGEKSQQFAFSLALTTKKKVKSRIILIPRAKFCLPHHNTFNLFFLLRPTFALFVI